MRNIEILNLSQWKEEETIWCQNQIIILQSFSQNIYWQQKPRKTQILLNKPLYLGLSILELSKGSFKKYVRRAGGEEGP